MLLTKTIQIRTRKNANIKYYLFLGYSKIEEYIDVDIKDIPKNSNIKVLVKCDICGKEKNIVYQKYNKNIEKYNFYSCSQKCAKEKKISTNLNKYGVEFASQNKDIKEKIKQTFIKNYGVDNPSKSEKIKQKYKNTCLKRYGVENVFQSEKIKQKSKNTCLKKYNVDNFSKTKEYKEKYKLTNMNKYGVEHYSKIIGFSKNVKQILLKKYGNENYNNREKYYQTCLIKYNKHCTLLVNDIIDKIKKSKVNNNRNIPENLKNDFIQYKKIVKSKTNKIREKLFENWNGIDFYDRKNIRKNLKLHYNHKEYPTIDHKTSIFNCFINGLDINYCCSENNLCITTRYNNSKKNNKNYLIL